MVNTQLGTVLRHLCGLAAARDTEDLSDTELLSRFCASREEAAFAALMHRHGRMVLGVCRDVLRHEQDAEDAFQATFLALASQAGSIRKGEAVAGYLHGVARRIALAARRAGKTRRVHERARSMPQEKTLSEEALREALGMLDDEVQCLPQRHRAVFVLCCLEGKSRSEVARELGWKEGTVASTLARARQCLQQRLARRGVTLTSLLCAVVLGRQAKAAPVVLLARSTLRAALSYAAGNDVTATVSGTVIELMQRARTTTMMSTKLKTATVFLLALGLSAVGVGVLASREAATKATTRTQAETRQRQVKEPADRAGARPAAPQDKGAQNCEVSGLVLGPDDKPFAGAKLFVVTRGAKKADLRVKATTGGDGRFRIRISQADLERDARLLATAAGHGPDWVRCNPGRGWPDKVRLRLVKEVPIAGRVLDGEGRPLAGIAVQVVSLETRADHGDLKPWIDFFKQVKLEPKQWKYAPAELEMIGISPAALGLPASVKTGKDGTFRLSGVGRERLVRLAIREPNREHADLCVLTTRSRVDSTLAPWGIYGPTFKHLVIPSRPIIGFVRNRRTGKPLAGIPVTARAAMPPMGNRLYGDEIGITARASTDDKGQFRLNGIGKHDFYQLHAGAMMYRVAGIGKHGSDALHADGSPYFGQHKYNVKDTTGLEPLRVDFELDRGVMIRGRLTDKVTGKPIPAVVHSAPLANNPNRKDLAVAEDVVETAADGSFTLIAVPGPGLLFVRADETERYARMEGLDDDSLVRDVAALSQIQTSPSLSHAVVRINLSAKDAPSTVRTIALEPGQTRTGTVVGPNGKPLTGVLPFGLSALDTFVQARPLKLTTATFTAKGLSKRTPRPLLFYHPEKRLSKLVWVKAGEGPLTVRLEPPGTMTGRVVDASGRPLAGIFISLWYKDVLINKHIPFAVLGRNLPGPLHDPRTKTDAEGKFRLAGCLPALKYRIFGSGGALGERSVDLATVVSAESGKVKDIGEVKIKESPKAKKEKEQ
jgi:RNA polymerase sigma factor (sigma-70 family)